MEKTKELFHFLQDPFLVARFQQMCGVRGTFSGSVSASRSTSGGSGKAADPIHSHNGACHHHVAERENVAVIGAGEAPVVRKRITDVKAAKGSRCEDEKPSQNGEAVSLSGGGTVGVESGAGRGTRRVAGSEKSGYGSDLSETVESAEKGEDNRSNVSDASRGSTVKPLRKNSLTGDVGQEFVIENRFLFYMFTFGTELGNELCYITFFPFIMWNVDAFVSRRVIMVWVWVMYLGQCTKDIIGWPRPASPPVVKVEMLYNSEYSMPSTHAMSGTAIPFSLFFMTCGRWQVNTGALLTLGLFFHTTDCFQVKVHEVASRALSHEEKETATTKSIRSYIFA